MNGKNGNGKIQHSTPTTPPNDPNQGIEGEPEWLESTPSFLDVQPARNIIKRLKKKEYIELWHFTAQGCRDAALTDLANPEGALGLVNTNDGLMLQTANASAVSQKAIKDENLSWEQLSEGKTRLLNCMDSCNWSDREIKELAKFFLKLDLHPIRSQDFGTQTVLRYQDRVRRNWVQRLNEGNPYAIGTINDTLMAEYQRQILTEIQAKNIVSLFPFVEHHTKY